METTKSLVYRTKLRRRAKFELEHETIALPLVIFLYDEGGRKLTTAILKPYHL